MFQSATLKLTAWYLGIIMAVSLLFSVAIYQLNYHEVNVRLENLQNGLMDTRPMPSQLFPNDSLRRIQANQAASQMVQSLVYINLVILIAGGFGSYILARRTLRPIEQAHEAQSRFTSDASHELRTPLAAMKAEIEVALRDKKLPEAEAKELLESNLEEVDKLIQLSEMLLNLSRLDYDRLELKRVDLSSLITTTLKPFESSKSRIDITKRKTAVVRGDKTALSELMSILIDNAIKYSDPDSKISIRIFEQMRLIHFEIVNTGPTISEENLPKLFDRFYRGDSSRTKSNTNGYGLGLALARKIVDVHHGDIQVVSKKNKTTFTFYLPILRINKAISQE